MSAHHLKVGYVPYTDTLTAPGDRRRFCAYAAERGMPFEIASPDTDYDVVVVSEAADLVTWSRYRPGRSKLVYDFIDSYLALRRGPMDIVRGIGKYCLGDTARPVASYQRLLVRMCRRADAVICTTPEQRALIQPHCANVHTVLDLQDDDIRTFKTDYASSATLNVFWEGLPYTLSDFGSLRDTLRSVGAEHPLAMHVMTDASYGRFSGRVRTVQTRAVLARLFDRSYLYEWNAELLSAVASACDLAVIPLDLTDPLARGKPENKLLFMWRMGLPVIGSATPAYSRAMRAAGVDGSCATPQQWHDALLAFASDEGRRRTAGQLGRAYAERECGRETLLARWDGVFGSLGISF